MSRDGIGLTADVGGEVVCCPDDMLMVRCWSAVLLLTTEKKRLLPLIPTIVQPKMTVE